MYVISTTIKKKWLDEILSGKKTSEFKGDTAFWHNRILKGITKLEGKEEVNINFLCGRNSYMYKVKAITHHKKTYKIDEQEFPAYFDIELGEQVNKREYGGK